MAKVHAASIGVCYEGAKRPVKGLVRERNLNLKGCCSPGKIKWGSRSIVPQVTGPNQPVSMQGESGRSWKGVVSV